MRRREAVTVQPVATPRSGTPILAVKRLATGWLVTLAAVSCVAHLLVAGNYGYFRDELYYIADGHHLQAGYVDQPLLMGWLTALLRVTVGDSLVAIHVIPALACALLVVITGLMTRELGGGRVAQIVASVAALFTLDFMAIGSLFSMDVLDQFWWALASLILLRLLRRDAPRLGLLVGLVGAVALLTKLTILFFGLGLLLALPVTPERRYLRTSWPWLAAGIAVVGLLPDLLWNAVTGWPTVEFYHHYSGAGSTVPLAFVAAQIGQMNPLAVPLAAVGLVFYFRRTGALPSPWLDSRVRLCAAHAPAHEAVFPGSRLPDPLCRGSGGGRATPPPEAARLDPARLHRPSGPRRHPAGAGCDAHPAAGHDRAPTGPCNRCSPTG